MEVIVVIVTTLIAIMTALYLFGLGQIQHVKKNWVQYRCNPIYMPMAGLVGDDVVSNFTKCTMKGFNDYAGFVMDPVMAEFSVVNDTLEEIGGAMHSMRSMFSGVRGGFLGIVGSVFGKIQNTMSSIQYIIIRMRTLVGRLIAVMYSFVYIFYTGMETGQSVVNGPVGGVMSFLCFDEDTKVQTFHGIKAIKDIEIGERLTGNLAMVTSTYKMDGTGVQMYNLSGIIVTGSHKVKYKNKFIRVDNHPFAKKEPKASKRLVCLNTNTHKISIRNYEFLDFDESADIEYLTFKTKYIQMLYNSDVLSSYTNKKSGILPGTMIPLLGGLSMPIQLISVGDVLDNGDVVKGICYHLLNEHIYTEIDEGILVSPSTWVYKNDKIFRAEDIGKNQYDGNAQPVYVYQLITNSSFYPVMNKKDNRLMILDELETTDSYYHSLKDSIITSGRFRGKIIVI